MAQEYMDKYIEARCESIWLEEKGDIEAAARAEREAQKWADLYMKATGRG